MRSDSTFASSILRLAVISNGVQFTLCSCHVRQHHLHCNMQEGKRE